MTLHCHPEALPRDPLIRNPKTSDQAEEIPHFVRDDKNLPINSSAALNVYSAERVTDVRYFLKNRLKKSSAAWNVRIHFAHTRKSCTSSGKTISSW